MISFFRIAIFFNLLVLFSVSTYADLPIYKPGEGAKYQINLMEQTTEVSIAIVGSTKKQIAIEVYMGAPSGSLMILQMWQRFHLEKNVAEKSSGNNPLKISKGFVYFNKLETPQELTRGYLEGYNKGAQMQDFLFRDKDKIAKHKVGSVEITVKAGKVKADQYKIVSNGQTIEFWISEQAKPLGLVKIISSGIKKEQNYSLEMTLLFSGAKAKIDPEKARPLNKKGKSFLPELGSNILFYN